MKFRKVLSIILIACLAISGFVFTGIKASADTDDTLYESFDTNIAKGKSAYASSNDRGERPTTPLSVRNLADGSESNYIVTHEEDTAPWFAVDLGSIKDINKVTLAPGGGESYVNSYPISYEVQVVTENTGVSAPADVASLPWATVATVTNGTLATKSITFPRKNARWVRIKVNSASATTCALKELYVFETDDSRLYTEPVDVLFIGNSMTYYNTLANVVKGIATLNGKKMNVTAATNGGKNLIYQSTAANIDTAIKAGGYEYVVLQDIVGSFDATNLATGAAACVEKIKQYNPDTQIIMYEPWPVEGRLMSDSLLPYFTQSYIDTSRVHDARLAPAGETFYDMYDKSFNYYCADEKHPLPLGTFISASTIYYTIYNNDALSDYTYDNLDAIRSVINDNIAYSGAQPESYGLSLLNLINERGYHYAHAVASAVADKSGNVGYKSVANREMFKVRINGKLVGNIREGEMYQLPTSGENYFELGYIDGATNRAYAPGDEIEVNNNTNLTGITSVSTVTDEKASIKMDINHPGISFKATTSINGEAPIVSDSFTYGMLITTYDFYSQQLMSDFTFENVEATGVAVANVKFKANDWISAEEGISRGGALNVSASNLVRKFISRAYVTIHYAGGSSKTVYSPKSSQAKSIKEVALSIKDDAAYYATLTEDEKAAVDAFAVAD